MAVRLVVRIIHFTTPLESVGRGFQSWHSPFFLRFLGEKKTKFDKHVCSAQGRRVLTYLSADTAVNSDLGERVGLLPPTARQYKASTKALIILSISCRRFQLQEFRRGDEKNKN